MATSLSRSQRIPLAKLALKYKLPSMFGAKENVEAGGLMSYAADYVDLTRRAATYNDKILKGANRLAKIRLASLLAAYEAASNAGARSGYFAGQSKPANIMVGTRHGGTYEARVTFRKCIIHCRDFDGHRPGPG